MIVRLVALAACGALLFAVAAAVEAAPKKLLVVSHTAGFRHTEGIEAGEKTLAEMAAKTKIFTCDFARTAEDVKSMMTLDNLKAYDGVIFLNTTGDIGIPDVDGFLAWIATGKAFIGMHSATDTYHGNEPYLSFIGDEFKTHGAQATIEPIVADKTHPATKAWPAGTRTLEEVYEFQHNDRSKVHVLLYLDKHPDDGHPNANQPEDHLIAWCKMHGKGRVFYTAYGHRGDIWTNPTIQTHMLGGIRWALGLARGGSKPGPAK